MTVELGFHFNPMERRDAHGEWTSNNIGNSYVDALDLPPDPSSLSEMAKASAARHPDVQRLHNQFLAAKAAGDMQRANQIRQQAIDMFNQKVQDYKDQAALKSFEPTAWEKAHPEEVRRRQREAANEEDTPSGPSLNQADSYDSGGMDELSNPMEFAAGSYRPPRVPAYKPTSVMRKTVSASMRKMADQMQERHPDLGAHQHIRDAARALDNNMPSAANRHLTAAVGNMTPQSLRRHGLLADDQHDAAKRSMDAVHRHMLLVKDIEDMQAENSQLPHADLPGASDGSNDLTDKPTARQPGGDKALNAPDTTNIGRIDINVSKPQQMTSQRETKQVAAATQSGDLTTAVELAFNPLQPRDHHGRWTGRMASADRLAVARHVADSSAMAKGMQKGGIGSHAHAEELRQLGRESDYHQGRNFSALVGSREGPFSRSASKMAAGLYPDSTPENPASRALKRAADMIDRGQPSLARAHSGTIREAASRESYSDPNFAARLNAAADKLDLLHTGQGLAAQPKRTRVFEARTVAARSYARKSRTIQAANQELGRRILELSAQTPALATTPHPFGKPGGPGLWHQKGMELPPYIQNIAHAILRQGRARDLSHAIAIAKASTAKWANTSKHAEVRSASQATNTDWDAKRAIAHAHANVSAVVRAIELGFGWKTEKRGDDGQWIGSALSDLASKLDSDHPGKGYGDEVRKAKDAAAQGDKDTADKHLNSVYMKVRASAGNKGMYSPEGRAAAGGAYAVDRMQRQLAAANLPKPASVPARPVTYGKALRPVTYGKALRPSGTINMSQVIRAIELVGTAAGAAKDTHVAAGSPAGGQFGSGGGGGASGAQSAANSKASQKAALLKRAAGLRAQAARLARQIALLKKALKGKTAKQAGSKTAAKKAVTPAAAAKAAAAKTPAGVAAAAKAKAATAATPAGQVAAMISAAGKAVTPAQIAAMQQHIAQAQIKTQIAALTKQAISLLSQAAALTAQAAKL
jgi:hypothetical protein